MVTGVHIVHISIYAFLTHKAKSGLLVSEKETIMESSICMIKSSSYKKHAMSFSLLHNTIREKIVSLVTVPSPILPMLCLNNPLDAIFSPPIMFLLLVLMLCLVSQCFPTLTTHVFNILSSHLRNGYQMTGDTPSASKSNLYTSQRTGFWEAEALRLSAVFIMTFLL